MSKQKTRKALTKRVRITGTGKVKHARAGKRHLNCGQGGNKLRHLSQPGVITGPRAAKYILAMGGM
jgi:large subunit ribosomal protein L35